MRSLVISVVLTAVMVSLAGAGPFKIGVVDVQKVVFESKRGQKAKAEWEKEYQEKKKKIDKLAKEIEKMREELKKNAAVLSEKAKKQKEEELRKKMMEYQFARQEAMRYLQKRNAELVDAILKDVMAKVKDYAKKNGYTMIIDVSGRVVYHDNSIDLTKQVIKLLDAQESAKGKKK